LGLFRSAHRQKIATAAQALCAAHADILALDAKDIAAVVKQHGLGHISPELLSRLLELAIERDVHRLIEIFRASGWTSVQPARLVGDWAIGLGLPAEDVARVAAASPAPVALARAYLHVGRIDVPQREVLVDIATAYGAPPASALRWIEAAVSTEIDRQVENARQQGPWWRRLAGSQPR
jgi:hypothetical protein